MSFWQSFQGWIVGELLFFWLMGVGKHMETPANVAIHSGMDQHLLWLICHNCCWWTSILCKLFCCEHNRVWTHTQTMKTSLGWVAQAELRLLYQFFMPAVNFHHTIILPSRYEQLRGWASAGTCLGAFWGSMDAAMLMDVLCHISLSLSCRLAWCVLWISR